MKSKLKTSAVDIFDDEKAHSLRDLSPAQFNEEYKDYAKLLVHQDGLRVVAGSRSGDQDELLDVYLSKFSDVKSSALMVRKGPAALQAMFDAVHHERCR